MVDLIRWTSVGVSSIKRGLWTLLVLTVCAGLLVDKPHQHEVLWCLTGRCVVER